MRVVVTGGASGIGRATVERVRRDGAAVGVIDRDAERLSAVDADATAVADVSAEAEIGSAIDAIAARLGGLDAVVTCAGVAGRGTVVDTEPAAWDRIFSVNVRGTYLTARAAIPHLRRAGGGAIVLVASQLGLVAAGNAAAYCASKGAVVQLARAMAVDHGGEGIRVNAICPGPTDTPLLEPYFSGAADPAAERLAYERMQVHGRLVSRCRRRGRDRLPDLAGRGVDDRRYPRRRRRLLDSVGAAGRLRRPPRRKSTRRASPTGNDSAQPLTGRLRRPPRRKSTRRLRQRATIPPRARGSRACPGRRPRGGSLCRRPGPGRAATTGRAPPARRRRGRPPRSPGHEPCR